MAREFDSRKEGLAAKLREVAGRLFTVDNMRISYRADEAGFARLEQEAGALTGGLPEGDGTVYPFACSLL